MTDFLVQEHAKRITRALIDLAQVVPDYRMPQRVRLGPAPITSRFVDVINGMERIRELVSSGRHLEIELDF